MIEYVLTRLTLDNTHDVPLTAEEFANVRTAHQFVMAGLGVEEKYNLVLANFEELEGEMLRLTLRHALYWDFDWSTFVDDAHGLNRRLVNLLSTGRLYRDHVLRTTSTIYGRASSELPAVKRRIAEELDSRLGYRTMEELRNHAQHRELPIAEIGFPGIRVDGGAEKHVENISIRLDAVKLRDGGFDAAILAELAVDDQGGSELKPLIREYVAGIGQIHDAVRKLMTKGVSSGETVVLEMISRYKAQVPPGTSLVGLYAISREGEKLLRRLPLFEDPMKRRARLVQRNSTGTDKLRFIVTSE